MARRATIIGSAIDIFGRKWDVRESRPTRHGWPVLIGWPKDVERGPGGGGPRTIITKDLASYLESLRLSPKEIDLPIGRTTLKRLRAIVGHDWYVDNCRWWTDNPSGPGKSYAAVSAQRKLRALRSDRWTREEDVAALRMHAGGCPAKDIAIKLGRSDQAVRCRLLRLRKNLHSS